MQTESNKVDEDWVDNLWIVIVFVKLDSVCLDLFQFGKDLFFCQVFQDLHFVDFKDLSEELLGCRSTLLSICVYVEGWIILKDLLLSLFW